MADYLIQDTTLDAIADAINAKTGGSSAMTPAEMVTAIGSISGGGDPWELIADYTSDDDATIVSVAIPSDKQNRDLYKVSISVRFKGSEYPYIGLNGSYGNYEQSTPGKTDILYEGFVTRRRKSYPVSGNVVTNKLLFTVGNILSGNADYPLEQINLKSYYENNIVAGCNIKVWVVKE